MKELGKGLEGEMVTGIQEILRELRRKLSFLVFISQYFNLLKREIEREIRD